MSKTNTYEDLILNLMRASGPPDWAPWLALLTVITDAEAGTVTEISYTGYARENVSWDAPSSGAVGISSTLQFGQRTDPGPDTVVGVGYYTLVTAGVLHYVFSLSANRDVDQNDTPEFAAGNLSISED